MRYKVRLLLAGLVALLAASSIMAAPVSAHPGPFWRQRAVGATGNGVKITRSAQEKFQSKGGRSVLSVAALGVEIICAEAQDKGTIWNNSLQGQGKVQVAFHKCTLIGNGTNCTVVEPIVFSAFLHLAWKYKGEKPELEQGNQQALGQKPDVIFTHSEIPEGAESINEKESFVNIAFTPGTGGKCTLASTETIGFESAQLYPPNDETWVKEAAFVFTPGKHQQHFWNGVTQVPVSTTLTVLGQEGTFAFEDIAYAFAAANGEPVEVAVFEN